MSKRNIRLVTVAAVWLLAGLYSFWPRLSQATADFNYSTDVTYRVQSDDSTSVTENYVVANNTARLYVTELQLSTPTDAVSNLKVTYDDGYDIPATTVPKSTQLSGITYNYVEIDIKFPRVLAGQSRRWGFHVTYSASGLVESKGSSHTIYVPSIQQHDPGDQYHVTVDAPQSFGGPHFTGAKGAFIGASGGRQLYGFDQTELATRSLALAFGDSTIYDVNFNFPLNNDSPLPQTFTVTLPPDLNNQHSYVNSLSPAPANTDLDADGNVLAIYHLSPHQHLTVTTAVAGRVDYLDYDLSASKKKADIPADLVRRYTKPSRYWQTDGAVAQAATKLEDDKAPVIDNVHRMYQYVIDTLSYNPEKIKFNIRQGSAATLEHPNNAVCLEYADLLIAMLRSQGIPARMPVGYAYSGSLKGSPAVSDSLHAWVEAYVPGIGWMTLDPTWGEKFDNFGHSDLDHFAFAVWGDSDSTPVAVADGHVDENYQYEQAKVEFSAVAQTVRTGGSVSLQRLAILPFVSLDQATVTAQPQIATDNNQLTIGHAVMQLGSLAPNQKVTVRRLVLGSAWNRADSAQFARSGSAQPIATTQATVLYWPMGLFLVMLLVVACGWAVLRLRERKANKSIRITDHIEH